MAFATSQDVGRRLGRTFTTEQSDHVDALLDIATLAIAGVCDKTAEWAETLNPVPPAVKVVCIEAAIRVFLNPSGARTTQESIGQYSYSATFSAADGSGIGITDGEELRLRRAVHGSTTAGVRIGAFMDETPCP